MIFFIFRTGKLNFTQFMSGKNYIKFRTFSRIAGSLLFFLFLIAGQVRATSIDDFSIEMIGGVKQAILIRGDNIDNPVLLRLHGGPGYPYFPYLPKDGKLKELEDHFTMVYWEQRGTGASYSKKIKKSSMNVDQFVEDAHEVIQYIKNKLQVEKIYVWGHSWGSNLGILLAEKYPEDMIAYIGTGQSVFPFENERSCYQFALEKTSNENNLKGLKELKKIDTVNYRLKDALTVRKWIYSYGGVVYSNGEERSYVDKKMIKKIWQTPQYKFRNKINILLHPYYSGRRLWEDMKNINLFEQVPKLEVPVYFLLGKHDQIVSSDLAAEYLEILIDPAGKALIWFEHSAHRPFIEEPNKFLRIMTGKILTETYKQEYNPCLPFAEHE